MNSPLAEDPPVLRPGTGRRLAWLLALWAFAYACYRPYYAFGGTVGMIGEPVSDVEFRAINAVGAAIILVAAVLPPVAAACLALTVVGVLSGLDVVGSFRIG